MFACSNHRPCMHVHRLNHLPQPLLLVPITHVCRESCPRLVLWGLSLERCSSIAGEEGAVGAINTLRSMLGRDPVVILPMEGLYSFVSCAIGRRRYKGRMGEKRVSCVCGLYVRRGREGAFAFLPSFHPLPPHTPSTTHMYVYTHRRQRLGAGGHSDPIPRMGVLGNDADGGGARH